MIIDALQYSNWSREIFQQMRRGRLDCVHVTIAYHETCVETLRNIGKWNRLFEEHSDLIAPVGSAEEAVAVSKAGKTGVVFGFQNCSPIEDDYSLVEIFHALGVRFMQLTYNNQSPLACGCYESRDSGVTRFGKQVISEMNRVGMVVDMSHSAERSTLEAIDLSARPIAITHANPHSFAPAVRNKSDAVLKALAARGGMLGFSLYPFHLKDRSACRLQDFCAMVARTAEMVGVQALGIGSDLCQAQPDWVVEWMRNGRWSKTTDYGEAGLETGGSKPKDAGWPAPLEWFSDSTHYGNIAQGLAEVGFAKREVAQIMGDNWLQFFAKSFGAEGGEGGDGVKSAKGGAGKE